MDRESKVPEEYRKMAKAIENYEKAYSTTRVSIINNQIMVPVIFNNTITRELK